MFSGFVLLFNPSAITTAKSKGWKIDFLSTPYQINPQFNIDTVASLFGPSYNSKCFVGFYQFDFKMDYTWNFNFTRTLALNFTGYKENNGYPVVQMGNLFCFGNGSICGEYFPYWDYHKDDCYTGATCPLPVFTGWNFTTFCPNCTQMVCDTCDALDRSKCSACKVNTNTHLSGTKCVCDTNYYEVAIPIDTAALGLWNNLTPSLQFCRLNCSIVITGCQQDDCLNSSFCTICSAALNYVLLAIKSTDQTCILCNVQIVRCTTCLNSSHCSICDDGSYLLTTSSGGTCPLCYWTMPHCTKCTDGNTCTVCQPGYLLSTTTKQCYCNILYQSLLNCQSCITFDKCNICVTQYYLQPTTFLCKPCRDVTDNCKNCLSQSQCISCVSPYKLGPNGLCDQCESGYQFFQGFCMKQSGCISLVVTPDGRQICLLCAVQLHFVFDTKLMKCICAVGYVQFYQVGSLMKCLPVCGDGIVVPEEDCDDKNTQNDDGCDSTCHFQASFECSPEQPTKCVLLHIVDTFEYNYALRVIPQNKAILSFKISPPTKAFKHLKWQKMMTLGFFSEKAVKQSEITFSYSSQKNQLQVKLSYHEQLENTIMQASLKLDQTIIKSSKRQYFLDGTQLNGRNAPLTFDQSSVQSTYQNIGSISMVLVVLLTLQFYIGSYTHKMIGLETIQIIQTLYFSRMIVSSASTSLLKSMNNIQYSATGYSNSELIFGQSLTDLIQSESYDCMSPEFSSINLQKYFLLNMNFALIPVLVAIVVFLMKLRKKIATRNLFLQTKEQQVKDVYTQVRRSCQWAYDHLVFPLIMMFNMVCFFENIMYFTSTASQYQSNESKNLQIVSFPIHIIMLLTTLVVYSFQVFTSHEDYVQYRMTERQRQRRPKSQVEKLQHDQNYPDRANYHPLYVMVYSLYYLLLQLFLVFGVLFQGFQSSLQLVLVITGAYFILVWFWKPYHKSINAHNHFLKLNHGTVVAFLSICYVLSKMQNLPRDFSIWSMYIIMTLIGGVMAGGFVRIWIQRRFRSALQSNGSLLDKPQQKTEQTNQKLSKASTAVTRPLLPKNFGLFSKNPYVFSNQINELGKKYKIKQETQSNQNQLTLQEQLLVIQKIRQENRSKQVNHFLEQNMGNEYFALNKEKCMPFPFEKKFRQ